MTEATLKLIITIVASGAGGFILAAIIFYEIGKAEGRRVERLESNQSEGER